MKKKLITMLSCLLTISLLGTGCSKKTTPTDNGAANVTPGLSAPGTFPITKDKTTLKILVPAQAYVQDFTTNDFTKYYEEKTNVHIEWNIVSGDFAQKKSVLFASGSYPDIFMKSSISKSEQSVYGSQGVLIPLNDLIEKNSVTFKQILTERPDIKQQITAPDGKIYGLPTLNEVYHSKHNQKMWVYKPWLDKLGIKMPETTDEFYEMLKAFKTKDPNGNGKADEIPYATESKGYSGVDGFLMNAFIYKPSTEHYNIVENGKITNIAVKPEFKEGLKYIRKLYKEDLMAPESLTMDRKQRTALGENPGVPILGAANALWFGMFTVNGADSGRYKDYIAIAPLKGPSGVRIAPTALTNFSGSEFNITKECKNPDVAIRWVDWLYTLEGTMNSTMGLEGVGWRKANPGEKGVDGRQANRIGLADFGQSQNKHWSQTAPMNMLAEVRLGAAVKDANDLEAILYNETKTKYEPYAVSKTVPDMFFTEDQSSEVTELNTIISKIIAEKIAQFVSGNKDIDAEWDSYVKELENAGLKRNIEIYQQAYDSYLKATNSKK